MEVVFTVLSILTTSWALQDQYPSRINNLEISGHFYGADSGQYIHDDSGKYIPDDSGSYRSDGLGFYSGDLSGLYKGINDLYKHNKDGKYGNGNYKDSQSSSNLLGLASNIDNQFATFNKNGDNVASSTNQVSSKQAIYKSPNDPSRYADGRWRIIRQDGVTDTDGYHWEYETENGITAEESGKVHNKGTDAEVMKAKGFFKYTGPDNVLISTEYTADERGFLPVGKHLPTPPPTPFPILRALEYLKSIGKL